MHLHIYWYKIIPSFENLPNLVMNIYKKLPRYCNKNWCKYNRVPMSKTGGKSDCNIKSLWFQYYKLYVTGYDKGNTNEKIVIDEEIEMIMKNNDNGNNKDKKVTMK